MKRLFKTATLGLLGLGLIAGPTYGITYNYSYAFNDGTIVSGSLNGDPNGNFVEHVTDVTVFFNGTAMSGTVFAFGYDGYTWNGPPVVSFDARQNNLIFMNSDWPHGDYSANEYIWMMNYDYIHILGDFWSHANAVPLGIYAVDRPTVQAQWSLTAVPDGGLTFAMLGMGIAGLASIRRQS